MFVRVLESCAGTAGKTTVSLKGKMLSVAGKLGVVEMGFLAIKGLGYKVNFEWLSEVGFVLKALFNWNALWDDHHTTFGNGETLLVFFRIDTDFTVVRNVNTLVNNGFV